MIESRLEIKLSPKLKQQFEDICKEDETTMSVEVRKMIANLVRNRTRQFGKVESEAPVTDSKPASKSRVVKGKKGSK